MSLLSSHRYNWFQRIQDHSFKGKPKKGQCLAYFNTYLPTNGLSVFHGQQLFTSSSRSAKKYWQIFSAAENEGLDPDDSEEELGDEGSSEDGDGSAGVNSEILRENLERIVGSDDSTFSGIDLATLIRNKYGRSYDIQLIKKEFMGRNLLALNVMWKYLEQAVSIFIDMDESGGRANEWIYK
ncbi:uncharacterized protein LOC116192197 isoform X2 [Punica granatum]|uniref:Uncharacterized protein LOC116192197 isoform X2 n=1 Tax=Punica granatum TaxID=22663 RepID=A0A6P8C5F1_PUNGR|nr:uncharacterized protein LOC116192197 isoform X2 [Punica granatum]